ncbi:hypothetical protein Hanom_Chr17g01571721 [Helianthus anomalus]
MHHVVTLIAERQKGTCPNRSLSRLAECYVPYVQGLMQNYYRTRGITGATSLFLHDRGKTVYILPSSDSTFVLLLW